MVQLVQNESPTLAFVPLRLGKQRTLQNYGAVALGDGDSVSSGRPALRRSAFRSAFCSCRISRRSSRRVSGGVFVAVAGVAEAADGATGAVAGVADGGGMLGGRCGAIFGGCGFN